MAVHGEVIEVRTKGDTDVKDVTPQVREVVRRSGIREGVVTVFVPGSTASVTTIEFEPGLRKDIRELLDRLIPPGQPYHHHGTWGDDNGHAHLRAAIVGPSVSVPVVDGEPLLGTWQQIVLVDFDTRPRDRRLRIQVVGEQGSQPGH